MGILAGCWYLGDYHSQLQEIYFVENCFNYLGCVHPIQDLLNENVRPVRLVDSTRNEDP